MGKLCQLHLPLEQICNSSTFLLYVISNLNRQRHSLTYDFFLNLHEPFKKGTDTVAVWARKYFVLSSQVLFF